MTMHIYYNHNCPQCETAYIPYDDDVPCPKCGLIERKRFDFVPQAANSALYNLSQKGDYVPGAWFTGTLGDYLMLFLFHVLDLHKRSQGATFSDTAASYFGGIDFGDKEFMRPYMIRLSERVFKKINELIAGGYDVSTGTDPQMLAARIRQRTDTERRSLPGSAAKQRLRESRPKDGVVRQADGTWLVYTLDDDCQIFYQQEDASYILVMTDANRLTFENIAKLVKFLDTKQAQ